MQPRPPCDRHCHQNRVDSQMKHRAARGCSPSARRRKPRRTRRRHVRLIGRERNPHTGAAQTNCARLFPARRHSRSTPAQSVKPNHGVDRKSVLWWLAADWSFCTHPKLEARGGPPPGLLRLASRKIGFTVALPHVCGARPRPIPLGQTATTVSFATAICAAAAASPATAHTCRG